MTYQAYRLHGRTGRHFQMRLYCNTCKNVFQTTFEPSFVARLSFLHRRVILVSVDFEGVSDVIFSVNTRCCPQVIDLLRIELSITSSTWMVSFEKERSQYPQNNKFNI